MTVLGIIVICLLMIICCYLIYVNRKQHAQLLMMIKAIEILRQKRTDGVKNE